MMDYCDNQNRISFLEHNVSKGTRKDFAFSNLRIASSCFNFSSKNKVSILTGLCEIES